MPQEKRSESELCTACGGTGLGEEPADLVDFGADNSSMPFKRCKRCGGTGRVTPRRLNAARLLALLLFVALLVAALYKALIYYSAPG